MKLASVVRPGVRRQQGQWKIVAERRGRIIDDAGLEKSVGLDSRSRAKLDVGDQSFAFWRIDRQQADRRNGGDNRWRGWRILRLRGSISFGRGRLLHPRRSP